MYRTITAGTVFTLALFFGFGFLFPNGDLATSSIRPAEAGERTAPKIAPATATFAAGCYWCVESDFDKVKGVIATVSGFMGGSTKNPTYKQVSRGGTGHLEVVQITYDPNKVSYQRLLDHYWVNVDPLDGGGQFCDRGQSYLPAIFVHNDTQRQLAEASKAKIAKRFERPIAVEIRPASRFTRAAKYHQNYYKKNPLRYKYYRYGCGRDQRLRALSRIKAS